MSDLVSTDWLAAHLFSPGIRVLDASFTMPGVKPTAREDHERVHIPGARFFDIETIADTADPLPHMLPPAEEFARHVEALGVSSDQHVIVYDSAGLFSAGRAWWMFRVFGHHSVAVLDGGLPKWLAEDRPVESGTGPAEPGRFLARFDPASIRRRDDILANLASSAAQVIDARSRARFEGSIAEPRAGLRSGHIPGSLNLPYELLTDPVSKTLLPLDQLRARFAAAGLDLARPVVTSCGSGVTAAALAFALHLLGHREVALYDGSWAEWGLPIGTPVEAGPARTGG